MALADHPSEELVLSCLMRWPAEVGGKCVEAGMSTEWFSDPQNQILYRHLLGVWAEGKPIERFAIAIALQQAGLIDEVGGMERIQRLFGIQGSQHAVETYIDHVRDCFLRRRLTAAAKGAYMDAQGDKPIGQIELELAAVINRADEAVEIATPKEMSTALLDRSDGQDVIQTGFRSIDRYCGPLFRGDFLTIGGKRKAGKSIFASNIAANIAKHSQVVFFSAEMGKLEVWKRASCAESGVTANYWKPGHLATPEMQSSMAATLKAMQRWKIGIIDSVIEVDQAIAICRSLKARYGSLGAVVFDYLQLFNAPVDKRSSRAEAVSAVSRACKRAAVALNTLVIGISQLNDDGLSLDSRGIERDCNLMLNIDDDKNVFVAANRNGPQGVKLDLKAELALCRFIET